MKQKSQKHRIRGSLQKLGILFAVFAIGFSLSGFTPVLADSLSDQIRQLQQQNAENRAKVADLSQTATSYQNAIAELQGQIDDLQDRINANTAKQAELQTKIEEGQRELERQKGILGADIKAMYVDGDISTIEMLATSKNLSDFVDKEAYRNVVQNKIQDTLKKVQKLQAELQDQKNQIELLLAEQKEQKISLDTSRNEQSRMLRLNQQEQTAFNQRTKDNQARIDNLIEQQRRANNSDNAGGYYFIRFPGAIKDHDVTVDDYPYKPGNPYGNPSGFSMSTLSGCGHPDPRTGERDSTDRWGYCTRQCVSYAAWAVERSGRDAPNNYRSAKNWIDAAPASWVHRDPQPGDVAITTTGQWGHAMYVEKVDGDRIYVSQYNQQLKGEYSTQWRTYR